MATDTLNGRNIVFPIYNEDGTPFHNLVLRKSVIDSVVMSLGDKITGDVYYKDNTLQVTMKEYVEYNGIHFSLVNPPTIVREGLVADNGELKGMTKYSFEFYHPMYQLSNFPFTDVATKTGEEKYLSQNKSFSWIGKPQDYIDKLNKNLQGTVWYVRKSDRFPVEKNNELSEVLTFDNVTVADAIKTGYETWDIPYVVSQLPSNDPLYAQGKRFVVEYGLPSNEIYASESERQLDSPFVFHMGHGVGLKNNSRTPRNNKIVTRIAGYGSEDNVPYGYPQIVWTGNQDWDYTINNNPNEHYSYPIYKGIVGGQYVKLIKHPFTRTHLMPSIYTETVNKKVNPNADGYDPTIEIRDYYDAVATQEYPYINEINPQAPSYESHEFADIKPELDADRDTGIVSAVPLNADLTPADHWDDSMDDDGNYLQSYFQITLPQLSFDLYACAAITQEMQINMRSGACIGCNFTVQVDWDDYKKNFYDSDGNFLPDGKQRDLEKYPKSTLGQISVVVQKDNTTFGTLMPNIYQQPKANDLFVFIGISLPLSYITSAETRLDDAMKSYMLENNVFYFDYPLKFDEHFLATHANILGQIRPNSIIHFDFGGVEQQLFVKQITVKYGNSPLPQYDITLTDNIEVVLNQIGQVADDVEKMSSLISILRQTYTRNVWNELAKKLSKTQDDTAQGSIRFMKGLQVGEQFISGILGEGGVFRKDADGKTYLEADKMYVRMKAYFDNVEIRDYNHSKGNRIASSAGATISRVAYLSTYDNKTVEVDKDGWYTYVDETTEEEVRVKCNIEKIRCYFRGTDGEDTVSNDFKIGDQVFCRVSNVVGGNLYQHGYWRLCIAKDSVLDGQEHWVDLSNSSAENIDGTLYSGYAAGSDLPLAQDDIVQLGNVNDKNRQGAIIEYVTGEDAPAYQIYQGLGDISALSDDATIAEKSAAQWSLENKNYINIGYNSDTGRADMKVYGDMYVGDRGDNPSSYIRFVQQHEEWVTPEPTEEDPEPQPKKVTVPGKVEIKAELNIQSTFGGKTFNDAIGDTTVIKGLQNQIDGAIESWFLDGSPLKKEEQGGVEVEVLDETREPYKTWLAKDTKTDEETGETVIVNTERLKHLGDLYYDNQTGYAYRFANTGTEANPVFTWLPVRDTDIIKALEAARKAQDTADGKRTIYSSWGAWMKEGVNTLEVGDLYIPYADEVDQSAEPAKTYYKDKVYKCITKGTNDFQEINYTDDTYAHRFDYLSTALEAMQGSTLISGGLVLSNLIALRDNASTPNVQAGINGVVDSSKSGLGIAAWYGGDMGDIEHKKEYPVINAMGNNARWAKSLFRFDGSGYLAGGNITWDALGAVTIKNITTLYAGQSTDILNQLTTFSNMFHNSTWGSELRIQPRQNFDHINLVRGTGSVDGDEHFFDITDSSVLNFGEMKSRFVTTAFFSALFGALKSDDTEMAVNDANVSTLLKSIKAKVGFWTEQYVSALGKNSASTGGGALANLVDVELDGDLQSGQVLKYKNGKWRNADDEGVSTISWNDITDKPTEFTPAAHNHDARYYISDGTIHLGNNSITPLTSFTEEDPTVPAWAKAETKPSYAFNEITGTATASQLPNIENLTNFSTKVYDASESRTKNTFLAAPDGVNGLATFRAIVSDDIPSLAIAKITGLQTALDSKALKSIKIQAGNGLTGGGTLEANRTLSILLQTNSGLSVNANGLKLDIVNNSSTSSDYKAISATQFKALYDFVHDLFTKETENGVSRIKANYGLYTESFLSALGLSDAAGGIGDVTWDLLASAATGGRTIHASYITDALRGYATQAWVQNQGYLTSHQSLAGYATEQWVSANFNNYSLPLASSSVRGGVKVGYSESGKYYAIQLSNEKMYVYVPWTDTTYESKTEAQDGTAVSLVTTGEKYAWNHKTYTTSLATDSGTNQLTLAFGTKYKLTAGGTTFIFTMPAKPSYDFGDLTDHPTTISDYGITDAKFGTAGADYVPITLGATTKNVLTAHQSLSNYYTKNEADNKYLTIVAFERLFQALDSSDAKVSHPYASGVASIKAMVGLWTNEYLSALGKNSASGGVGDVTWELLAGNDPTRQIHLSHLTTALSGYALTSQIPTDNNQLTNGAGYITASALNGYATQSWVQQQGYLTSEQYTGTVTSVAMTAPTGFSISGSPITASGTLALAYASGYEGFTTALKNKIDLLYSLFTREGSGTASDPYVIKANYGLYTDSFLSALGLNNASSGGATAITDLVDVAISSPSNGQVLKYNSTTGKWYNGTDNNSGSVTQINVGTTQYLPESGVVTLPAYPTKSSWNYNDMYVSAVALNGNYLRVTKNGIANDITIPYATSAGNADTVDSEHASAFAHRNAANNLLHSSNEFTFVPDSFSGEVYINYRTASYSANGNITKYVFYNGKSGALATISSGQFSGNAATATKLQTACTLWGRSFDGSGNISGDMSNVGDVKIANNKAIRFVPNGTSDDADWNVLTMNTANALALGYYSRTHNQETSIQGGRITFSVNQGYGSVATANDQGLLAMTIGQDGGITLSGKKRITFGSSDAYIEVDSNGYFHFSRGVYSDSFVSALGLNAGGSGGVGDVTWELLASSSDTRQINKSHLTTALSGYAATSQLSDYLPLTGGTINGNLEVTSTAIFNVANAVTLFLKEGWKVRMQESGQEEALLGFDTSHNLLLSVGERSNIVKLAHKVNGTSYSTALSVNTSNRLTADGNVLAYKSEIPSSSNFMTANTDQTSLGGSKKWIQDAQGASIIYGNTATQISMLGIDFFSKELGVSGTTTLRLAGNTSGRLTTTVGNTTNTIAYLSDITSGSVNYATSAGSAATAKSATDSSYAGVLRDPVYHSPSTSGRRSSGDFTVEDGGLHYYLATSSMTTGSARPADGYILHLGWDNSAFDSQLWIANSDYSANVAGFRIGIRHHENGTWGAYRYFIDSSNIGSQSVAYATTAGSAPASDVYAWAKAANKPSYSLSELSNVNILNVSDGQVLTYKANVGWVNLAPSGGGSGTVTSIATGTGLTGGTITSSGTISINSTYQTYISHGNTAYGWGNHANAGYLLKSGGYMSGNIVMGDNALIFGNTHTSNWNLVGNKGIRILNAIGTVPTGGPNGYAVSLLVSGYYTFQIAAYGGDADRLYWRQNDAAWKQIIHTSNIDSYTGGSDIRQKDVLNYEVCPAVETIANAPTIRFTWKPEHEMDRKGVHLGSIAQYWQSVLPECVTSDNKGYLSMQYNVIALLSAISIAKKVIDHEQRITELERENERLRTKIEQLNAA